jgi:hypothetical protein
MAENQLIRNIFGIIFAKSSHDQVARQSRKKSQPFAAASSNSPQDWKIVQFE